MKLGWSQANLNIDVAINETKLILRKEERLLLDQGQSSDRHMEWIKII